jgi:hypothetical protein
MGKLAQYRLLKKVKKILDTPVKNEEAYNVSATTMYIGDKTSRSGNHESNPSHTLHETQVSHIALMLLQQISRMEQPLQGDLDAVENDDKSTLIGKAFVDIAIAFAELDVAILFTEAEKSARRQKLARLRSNPDLGTDPSCNNAETLQVLRLRIEEWQLENIRKQRKVSRVETTIRDLGLNVNDVRCAQILSEKREAVAAAEATVTAGARLCRQTCKKLEGMFAVASEK